MAVSDAQKRATARYLRTHYTQVKLCIPNEEAEALNDFCDFKGYSKAGFIRDAIREKIEREGW